MQKRDEEWVMENLTGHDIFSWVSKIERKVAKETVNAPDKLPGSFG